MSSLSLEHLQQIVKSAHVKQCADGKRTNIVTGDPIERLPPALWEELRIVMQERYRRATGETMAILTVEIPQI